MMRHLSRDANQLTLIVPDEAPLRAAAKAVRSCRFLGVDDGCAVYEYSAEPDVADLIVRTFQPSYAGDGVPDLLHRAEQLRAAQATKASAAPLVDMCLRTEPYLHQVQAFNFAWSRWMAGAKGTGLLMEMGTGKTLVAVALANALRQAGRVDWAMVVCPNSLRGTWAAEDGEISRHSAIPAAAHVLEGSRLKRAVQFACVLAEPLGLHQTTQLDWVVTNYDQFSVDAGSRGRGSQGEVLQRVLDSAGTRPGLLVLDESTFLKNPRSRRSRAVLALAQRFPYRLILTGTPVTQSPLDAFGQFEVLERGSLGFNTYLAFERAYAVYRQQRVAGGRLIQVPDGYQNLEDLEHRLSRLSYRARAADCLDLPPVVVRDVPVQLSAKQARTYQQLVQEMIAEADDGKLVDGRHILTRYGKLAQICGGYVNLVDAEGNPAGRQAFDPNPKMDALLEYLDVLFEDGAKKAVVFCQYVAEVERILEEATERGWQPAAMYGKIDPGQREEGRRALDADPRCRLMVCQYQCGSLGLNLTAASTVVFYSLTFSLQDYLQAQKRVHRVGQTAAHVNEVYLVAERPTRAGPRPTIDAMIRQALRDKKDLADVVTGDRARQVMEAL